MAYIFEALWPAPEPLPDAVYLELVDGPFGKLRPVVALAVSIVSIGGLVAAVESDIVVAALTIGFAFVAVARIASILAYRRRAASAPLTVEEASVWERRYALGIFAFAVAIGAMAARTVVMDQPLLGLLIVTLVVTYVTSIVARISVRPSMCFASALASTVPVAVAFGWHVHVAGGAPAVAVVAMEAFIIPAFAASTLAAIGQNYRLTLQQVLDKRRLALMVGRDALTGLPNRSLLPARFEEGVALARRSGEFVAVHCLDLDRFKPVNDAFGHPTGDALLQAVARRLVGLVREQDTVARLGGDEFVVIQAGIRHVDHAVVLASRIVHDLGARYSLGDHTVEIGVSVGIAIAPRDGFDLERLIAGADAALYQAKRERRGLVVHDGGMVSEDGVAA